MPTPRSVSDIKSKLLRPALTSHFEVQLSFPQAVRSYLGVNQDSVNLSCCETSLPGSQLATLENNNDRTGVTEKHAHRKIYDDRIDLTFYVNAENYMPIRFFETWINYITQQSTARVEGRPGALDKDYFYRFEYPDTYMSDSGMRITKFEKSSFGTSGNNFLSFLGQQPKSAGQLTYTFIRAFPLSIASMPVSYDQSNLLKCTVSMSYVRYVVDGSNPPVTAGSIPGGQSDSSRATDTSFPPQILTGNSQAINAAAAQFNATSTNQTNQFMSSLANTVNQSNAQRDDAMSQFNTTEANRIAQVNAGNTLEADRLEEQLNTQIDQYNANLGFQRDQFNTQNAIAIEQSNVQWRRQTNTANTAGQNSVNQANAMNAFNLSNQGLSFLWQEMRDAAKWEYEAAQNSEDRASVLAQAALGNEAASDAVKSNNLKTLGQWAIDIWKTI